MTLENDFTYYLSAETIRIIAQELHNTAKWRGLNEDQYKMLNACKNMYRQLRNEEIPLEYNCPA